MAKNGFKNKLGIGILGVATGFLGFVFLYNNEERVSADAVIETCLSRETSGQYDQATVPCYIQGIREIIKHEGIAAALRYADDKIRKWSTFSITHVVMHEIGYAAGYETNDFEKALSYIPKSSQHIEHYFHYDGYQHGVFMVLFRKKKDTSTIDTLIREACPRAFETRPQLSDDMRVAIEQCFHAVGHALMYAFDNDPFVALPYCDSLSEGYMKKWCYFGVFMENSYLYSSFHNPEGARPYVTGNSMLPLCFKVDEKYRLECAKFAGRAYLHVERGNWKGLFRECSLFAEKKEREVCVGQGARLFIPMFYENDFKSMEAACENDTPYLKEVCLGEVGVGIRQGAAGIVNTELPFCESIAEDMRESCKMTVENMYVEYPPSLH